MQFHKSVYKVIELVRTSSESWEKAAAAAVSEGWEGVSHYKNKGRVSGRDNKYQRRHTFAEMTASQFS
jgi:flavin-binding protein dodecin